MAKSQARAKAQVKKSAKGKPAKAKAKPAAKPAARTRGAKPTKLELPAARNQPKPAAPRRAQKPTKLERPVKAVAGAPKPVAAIVDDAGLGWVDAGKGYQLTLDAGKLACKNDKGKRLSSVPKEIKDGDVADQLEALRDWLVEHDRECIATVEQWMLRSLAVPRAVLEAVWEDPSWRRPLENAVVVAVGADGGHDHEQSGLFRGVDPKKGVGVVNLDGETAWLDTERVGIPHPILIPELDAWRELVTQLGVAQGIAQLHRETHPKPQTLAGSTSSAIDQFEDGKFAMLMHAVGKARQLGYKVRGGFATCKVWDAGAVSEARYWIGAEGPESETYTGQLSWVDGRERGLRLAEVGPVAFSEGMRMASAIFAARVVEKEGESS
ncbi:MAG TPA: DUF4132 domain-containing protein [Kofleriaceae bacterium]|nr:DUF4132 domain-containing protein [Kofleriaceae bacterium]